MSATRRFWIAITAVAIFISISLIGYGGQVSSETIAPAESYATNVPVKLAGVCYGPSHDGEDPNDGILPSESAINADISLISNMANSIRTYGITGSMEAIPQFCDDTGLNYYPGAWISQSRLQNDKEISTLIKVGNQDSVSVKSLLVGNEVLLRGDIPEEELIAYIQQVKAGSRLPVGTAEPWYIWLDHPGLAQAVDVIFVHIYPYWDGISLDIAPEYVFSRWQEIKDAFPGKKVIIGETGWPTQGDGKGSAVPGEANQQEFLSRFLILNQTHNAEFFLFEVFDEKWKEKYEGTVGAHWGLYFSNGYLKPLLRDLFPQEAGNEINRNSNQPTAASSL